jgi:thioredoxin reductase (NADPH)
MTSPAARPEHVFPTLTPAQTEHIAAHGRRRRVQAGDVLLEANDNVPRFFVVVTGQLEITRVSGEAEQRVATISPGQFTGELNVLSGRRALVRIRAIEAGEIIEVDRAHALGLVQTTARWARSSCERSSSGGWS